MARLDRRTATELRPLALSQAVLPRADGSAKWSFGNVTVLASVTGPSEVRIVKEKVDRATLEINVRPLRGVAGPSSKAMESTLASILSPLILLSSHPRSLIRVNLQTLSLPSTLFVKEISSEAALDSTSVDKSLGVGAGAGEKAANINAAVLALLDAGVELRGMITSVAVAFIAGELLLDPTPAEEDRASSLHVFGFSFGVGVGGTEGECVCVDSLGKFGVDELFAAQDQAREACRGVLAFIRKSVERRYGVEPVAAESAVVEPAGTGSSSAGSEDEEEDMEE